MENNMTEKLINVIGSAQQIAKENSSQEIDVPHIIKALMDDDNSMLKNVLQKCDSNPKMFDEIVTNFIKSKFKSSNVDESKMYLSVDTNNLLVNGEKYRKEFKDSYLSTEHIILALFDSRHSIILKLQNVPNFNKNKVKEAILKIRGGNKVEDRNPEEKYEVLQKYGRDVGTCNLCGQDMYEFIHILGKRVKAVVIRDCNGHDESSLLPFTCVSKRQSQTNWLSLIRGLREITFDGIMILDMEDTASAFSPLLRPQLMALAKSIMDFLKFQVEIESILQKYKNIILFGAGNMCRNYMKCYGEKYTPLFTCDNNKAMWGTSFCGLEVKNPEVLREIPDDCVVFICNVYYREIEKQLRDMGVKNIEFFNDEYMPSFHFDRLERG